MTIDDTHVELCACSPSVLTQLDYTAVMPKRQYIRYVESRVCWLCNKAAPNVRFRSAAHVVPQALGNRFWCTLEECDTCNNKMGALESDMIDSTNGYRLTSEYQGRGSLKFKWPNHRSFLRALDDTRNVFLSQAHGESGLLEHISDKEFVVKVPMPGYRPLSICKVLARLGLLLCPDLRASYKHLIPWLRGETMLGAQLLLCGDSKGKATFKPRVVVFRYTGERKMDSDIAVVLVYEGLFYWYVLPGSSETPHRVFIDGSLLAEDLGLNWKLRVVDECSMMPAGEIEVTIVHSGQVVVTPNDST